MKKEEIHHDGYWRCVFDGKRTKDWKKVNCKECLNDRHNHETSLQVGEASLILNGGDLKELREDLEKRNPDFKEFRLKNHSKELKETWVKLNKISQKTKKIKTAQGRLDFVRSLSENQYGPEKYLITATAHCWFSKLK